MNRLDEADYFEDYGALVHRLTLAEAALRDVAAAAGHPDAAEGCRNVIAIASAALAPAEKPKHEAFARQAEAARRAIAADPMRHTHIPPAGSVPVSPDHEEAK